MAVRLFRETHAAQVAGLERVVRRYTFTLSNPLFTPHVYGYRVRCIRMYTDIGSGVYRYRVKFVPM